MIGSTVKSKNLLLWEKLLSFKSRPSFRRVILFFFHTMKLDVNILLEVQLLELLKKPNHFTIAGSGV